LKKVAGVIGWPIEHSRSPAIHNVAYRAAGLDAVYLAFAVEPARLKEAIAGVRALGLMGLNVTVPHKQAVMPFLDEIDDIARDTGAVNTIVPSARGLSGTNTDVMGFLASLDEQRLGKRRRAVVLGAGGAARAVVVALRGKVASLAVSARDPEKAALLGADVLPWGSVGEGCDLLVDATSMALHDDEEVPIPVEALAANAAVCSLVYHREPRLVAAARARGLHAWDGAGMLVYQAACAFSLMTGLEAPISDMFRALRESLKKA
jgi:shikimate dehydrogenase